MASALEIAQKYAKQSRDRREDMRERYPDHAALTDWARGGGLEIASVTVSGKTFGKRTKDAQPPMLIFASEVQEGLRDGRIILAGKERVHTKRFRGGLVTPTETDADL